MNDFLRHLMEIMDQMAQPQPVPQPSQQQMGPPDQRGATMQVGQPQVMQSPSQTTIPGLDLSNQLPTPMGQRRGAVVGQESHPAQVDVGQPTGGSIETGQITIEHPNGAKMHIPGDVFKHIMKSKPKKK